LLVHDVISIIFGVEIPVIVHRIWTAFAGLEIFIYMIYLIVEMAKTVKRIIRNSKKY